VRDGGVHHASHRAIARHGPDRHEPVLHGRHLRLGLSTSLLDVTHVVAAIVSATLFGVLTGSVQNYPQLMVVAAGMAAAGAAVLFAAHRLLPQAVPATSR